MDTRLDDSERWFEAVPLQAIAGTIAPEYP
jgi:hypothetical protein